MISPEENKKPIFLYLFLLVEKTADAKVFFHAANPLLTSDQQPQSTLQYSITCQFINGWPALSSRI